MFGMRKGLIGFAFLALAILGGVAFLVVGRGDDGPEVDDQARTAALRAERRRDDAVDAVLAKAPVIGAALEAKTARVVDRSAWNEPGFDAPVGELVFVVFREPVTLPASYRGTVDLSGTAASSVPRGPDGLIATEPLDEEDRTDVAQAVVLVDVIHDRVHSVTPGSSSLVGN